MAHWNCKVRNVPNCYQCNSATPGNELTSTSNPPNRRGITIVVLRSVYDTEQRPGTTTVQRRRSVLLPLLVELLSFRKQHQQESTELKYPDTARIGATARRATERIAMRRAILKTAQGPLRNCRHAHMYVIGQQSKPLYRPDHTRKVHGLAITCFDGCRMGLLLLGLQGCFIEQLSRARVYRNLNTAHTCRDATLGNCPATVWHGAGKGCTSPSDCPLEWKSRMQMGTASERITPIALFCHRS